MMADTLFKHLQNPGPWTGYDDPLFHERLREQAVQRLPDTQMHEFARLAEEPELQAFLSFVHRHSSYLTRAMEMNPEVLLDLFLRQPEEAFDAIYERFTAQDLAVRLRRQKQQIALAAGLLDIAGLWDWEKVTAALSDFACYAVESSLTALLYKAAQQQMIGKVENHGIFILGMGKLGGRELNYSSDIDLIIFYDPERLEYTGRQSPQHFMTRLAQELTALMQDRTAEGYVFRTDLRLRPDPASTPLAVSTKAALRYYESVGQNWERAAMIKARVVAGDHETGKRFMRELKPFMWRTHLDYAAVADILSIKRQMQSRYEEVIDPYGHNIKTGKGGIREIEFLAQIYQLIRGGREPELRVRKTVEVLGRLVEHRHINPRIAGRLMRSYAFFRTVEHRLQMRADEQTHTLPSDESGMQALAEFMGYASTTKFVRTLSRHLRRVHHHFTRAFQDTAAPLSGGSKLVFTGVEHDPETLAELRRMGFTQPETISAAVQDWHKGNRRCTRTKRSRQLLTELVPEILAALAVTVNPDEAFQHFDGFMTNLPSGVQLFSLFASNRDLLKLTAEIMGSAPSLGRTLSQTPSLFDAVLSGFFFEPLASREVLRAERQNWLRLGRDEEERLIRLCTFQKEKLFQAGIQLLKGMADVVQVGHFLSDLSDIIIEWVAESTAAEFTQQYGRVAGGGLIVLGMGKLGSRELTFGSDLDLNFLYDAAEDAVSDGEKSLNASAYYNRLAQRIVGRLTALTKTGRLYEVDTRLRPFGKDGPMAVSLAAFERYHAESAWLFERLALTRARIVVAQEETQAQMSGLLNHLLRMAVPPQDIAEAIRDMRRRINESFKPSSAWDVKHIPGGLMDVDFILQYFVLCHALRLQGVAAGDLRAVAESLEASGLIESAQAASLAEARALQTTLLFFLRLCSNGALDEQAAPDALKRLLSEACGEADFNTLKHRLLLAQKTVGGMFESLFH
jgi:glutamate-ammonia-ligase adenylyltransferase